jgi:hypothetical protein
MGLVEATLECYVLDVLFGRVLVEAGAIRFRKNGRGGGITVATNEDWAGLLRTFQSFNGS